MSTAILLIDCPDRKGIVVAVANFLVQQYDADILNADQHQDATVNLFFMRVEFTTEVADLNEGTFRVRFSAIAAQFSMRWRVEFPDRKQRVALFVSHYLHCLADLLHRYQTAELPCELALILSNHEEARPLAEFYHVPFHHIPVTSGKKAEAEWQQRRLLEENKVDLVILARYMQVLSSEFVRSWPQRIINVHHSFLPAFTGAKPYHAAFARGVKLIGATSHYVTEALDEGPIIEQDVIRISQSDHLPNLVQKGRDLERIVLARAVRWHLEHRILSYANKTVIFA